MTDELEGVRHDVERLDAGPIGLVERGVGDGGREVGQDVLVGPAGAVRARVRMPGSPAVRPRVASSSVVFPIRSAADSIGKKNPGISAAADFVSYATPRNVTFGERDICSTKSDLVAIGYCNWDSIAILARSLSGIRITVQISAFPAASGSLKLLSSRIDVNDHIESCR
jgi:hypothetical protein